VIFETDYEGLAAADAVVAVLDGTQVDDGTACEIGIFSAITLRDPSKKGIIGYMTEFRGLSRADHGYGLNLFVEGVEGVIEVFGMVSGNFDDVIAQLQAWAVDL
jgi:hypothetical protein